MAEEVCLKCEQTMSQKGPSPCLTVRHYPLRTNKDPLNKKVEKKEKMLSEKQKKFAENLARKLQEKHFEEFYALEILYKDCKEFLLTAQTDDDWRKIGNGLPNPLNL